MLLRGEFGECTCSADADPGWLQFDLPCSYLGDGYLLVSQIVLSVEAERVHGSFSVWRGLKCLWRSHIDLRWLLVPQRLTQEEDDVGRDEMRQESRQLLLTAYDDDEDSREGYTATAISTPMPLPPKATPDLLAPTSLCTWDEPFEHSTDADNKRCTFGLPFTDIPAAPRIANAGY